MKYIIDIDSLKDCIDLLPWKLIEDDEYFISRKDEIKDSKTALRENKNDS